MNRIAVVVPGIMGSVLYYPNSAGVGEIWSENFRDNYDRLLRNPGLLKWTGQTASARLLKTVRLSKIMGFLNTDLWKASLSLLRSTPDFSREHGLIEYGYDWRASLIDTAALFANHLTALVGNPIQSVRPAFQPRFLFLTHSMGGLVVRIALGLKLIDPSWIDRIIHLGSPLKGAPVAFRTAYERSSLPLLQELLVLFHWKNSALFKSHLLTCFKSFPSLYQLMPTREFRYLYHSPSVITNALDDGVIPSHCRALTEEAHQRLLDSDRVIINCAVKVFCIHTAIHATSGTDLMYRVKVVTSPTPEYQIEEVVAVTAKGDGTVPAESACGSVSAMAVNSVLNVKHADLCNDGKVAEILATILN